MPVNAQTNGNAFTFNKSTAVDIGVGYYSRILYTFVPCKPGFNGNLLTFDAWNNQLTGNVLQSFINSADYAGCSHGSITLPQKYWESGKTVRIRGTIVGAAEGANMKLNLRFGLQNLTDSNTYTLGIQNNDLDHLFMDGAGGGPLPVDFEFNICCGNSASAGGGNAFGYGFYVYDLADYSSAGTNRSIEYVPVWNGPTLTSTPEIGYGQTRIFINGYGSDISEAYLTNLFIEELA